MNLVVRAMRNHWDEEAARAKDLDIPASELFAHDHAYQWRGCLRCRQSHHVTAFCQRCGLCFFGAEAFEQTDVRDVVNCQCGLTNLWD